MMFKKDEFATRSDYWDFMIRCQGDMPADKRAAAVAWLIEEEKKPADESLASVWHAYAMAYNNLDKCQCVPCVKARKLAQHCGTANVAGVGYAALIRAFVKAKASGLKWPAITFDHVTFKLAGDRSKNPGHLYVTGGKQYGSDYYGKVTPSGVFVAAAGCPPLIADSVKEIGRDPLGQVIHHGKATGNCACCNRPLTDPVSVERGIGPICYERFFGGA